MGSHARARIPPTKAGGGEGKERGGMVFGGREMEMDVYVMPIWETHRRR